MGDIPALFTRTSIRPNSRYAASASASTCCQWPTWQATGSARRPVRRWTSPAVSRQDSSLRLAITTSAPAAAKASTMARPSPRLPPVTSATFPVRSNRAFASSMIGRSPSERRRPPRALRTVGDEDRDGVGVVNRRPLRTDRNAETIVGERGAEERPNRVVVARVGEGARQQVLQLVAQLVG